MKYREVLQKLHPHIYDSVLKPAFERDEKIYCYFLDVVSANPDIQGLEEYLSRQHNPDLQNDANLLCATLKQTYHHFSTEFITQKIWVPRIDYAVNEVSNDVGLYNFHAELGELEKLSERDVVSEHRDTHIQLAESIVGQNVKLATAHLICAVEFGEYVKKPLTRSEKNIVLGRKL